MGMLLLSPIIIGYTHRDDTIEITISCLGGTICVINVSNSTSLIHVTLLRAHRHICGPVTYSKSAAYAIVSSKRMKSTRIWTNGKYCKDTNKHQGLEGHLDMSQKRIPTEDRRKEFTVLIRLYDI